MNFLGCHTDFCTWDSAAFYGVLFPSKEEAAFSNYRLWESVGFIIAFAYTSYVSMVAKLAVLIAVLCLGMAGYAGVEVYREVRQVRNNLLLTSMFRHLS